MKRLLALLTLMCCAALSPSQLTDLKEVDELMHLSPHKLEAQMHKKGYKRAFTDSEAGQAFVRRHPSENTEHSLFIPAKPGALIYQTSSLKESEALQQQLKALGFLSPAGTSRRFFQKGEWFITCEVHSKDSTTAYVWQINKRKLPRSKDILYAEDLLDLNAHSYLEFVYGEQQVKRTTFPYTETIFRSSSVLFPGTANEVVFVWKDGENYRDIDFLIIGEQQRSKASGLYQVQLSSWRTRQGVRCGMNLLDLQQLHQKPLSFYNWHTESAGCLAPGEKGALDLEAIKVVFECLNCQETKDKGRQEVITSAEALSFGQKVFVSTFLIFPKN